LNWWSKCPLTALPKKHAKTKLSPEIQMQENEEEEVKGRPLGPNVEFLEEQPPGFLWLQTE